ncbi:MAG TPA: 50S ribosomal protein L11 methyltransferase [Micromonosporaceae bacterium]|nr:50S ribosomal protein L11 methyltransferase [Micromonosporaceae bacterium]
MTSALDERIRAHTAVAPVPFVPEVRLHQADAAIDLWAAMEGWTGGELPPPFWAFAWLGGQALARHLLDHPATVAGKSVLDLAAGSGLVAIAAARAGAAEVAANEIDEYALRAIALNASLNGVAVTPVPGDLLDRDAPGAVPDVVLAGDVFYRRPMAERVLPFLARARAAGARVLVGDPGRAYLPRERLVAVAKYAVPSSADLEDAPVKSVTVWCLP